MDRRLETIEKIRMLVDAFDGEEGPSGLVAGLPEGVYMATHDLIVLYLGDRAGRVFAIGVNATDGEFYSRLEHGELWSNVCEAAE